ncbi:MAG: hypothetical protein CL402_00860 [Acidiferrobacteraceae bacterium]|nr:hypothetical protein [Acidiferrobacteraceae bacterium]|tara:strand:- start:283 stop:1071 length:789 start_codon:yes stop_codon:yes gene_type:complete
MCTIGAVRLGAEYLLFKNKDFGRDSFNDEIVISKSVMGVKGVSTWASPDSSADQFSGFSIGANEHGLFCCDANVREEPLDGQNYDRLTEIALTEAHSVETAILALQDAVSSRAYWCSNLVMIDQETLAVVEVHGHKIAVERQSKKITRTNHHLLFDGSETDGDTITSKSRLSYSQKRIDRMMSIDDIYSLQTSHDNFTTGICNHAVHQTVYSYILYFKDDEIKLYVKKGRPCETDQYEELVLPFGAMWTEEKEREFRVRYPL